MRLQTSARIIVLYAVLALLTIPVFPHFLSPNEFSRWIAHALTAFALVGSWFFLVAERRPILSGALMGIAVLSEYASAVVAILFLICAAIWSRRHLVRFVIGGIPFLAILLIYNQLAFGN